MTRRVRLLVAQGRVRRDADELMMQALDAGAEDFSEEEDVYEVLTDPDSFERGKKGTGGCRYSHDECGSYHDSPELCNPYR